ncbi:MAG: hypothetical protein ACI9DC_004639 [Gammaproteobacteria bacterium]|jgi:hypothetical protein
MGITMIASLRNAFTALIFSALVGPVLAAGEAPNLKADHPSRYIVQKGDTLWDISGRFLNEPWRWPDVWQVNPQIENPDLIFPGDEILLSYKDGKPILRVRRRGRRGVSQLSPSVRAENLANEAIPTIPINVIQPFLLRPSVVTDDEFAAAPYILSVGEEALSARPDSKIYVRGLGQEKVTRYAIYRKGDPYLNPGDNSDVLGYEALHVGDAILDTRGDPTTMVVVSTVLPVLVGDRLFPINESLVQPKYQPRPGAEGLGGQIISVIDGVSQIIEYQTVVLNLGTRDGLEVGHVFAVYQNGAVIEDPMARDPKTLEYEQRAIKRDEEMDKVRGTPSAFLHGVGHAVETVGDFIGSEGRRMGAAVSGDKPWAEVTLPEERAGTIMVYRPFDKVSYALVMQAVRPMHILDTVKKP